MYCGPLGPVAFWQMCACLSTWEVYYQDQRYLKGSDYRENYGELGYSKL